MRLLASRDSLFQGFKNPGTDGRPVQCACCSTCTGPVWAGVDIAFGQAACMQCELKTANSLLDLYRPTR